jgi:arginyl-tRNA synthetase
MTTLAIVGLGEFLSNLGLKTPIPSFGPADVLNRPLDIGRSYLADIVHELADGEPEQAYKSIHWPNNIFNGDLAVIIPKLCPGSDPHTVGFDLTQKVFLHLFSCKILNHLLSFISDKFYLY